MSHLVRRILLAAISALLAAGCAEGVEDSRDLRRAELALAPDLPAPSFELTRVVVQFEGPGCDSEILCPSAAACVEALGGQVEAIFSNVGALTAELPADQLQALAECSSVRRISPDRPVISTRNDRTGERFNSHPAATPVENFVVKTTGADQVHARGIHGAGVTIALVDSGLDEDHAAFGRGHGSAWVASQSSLIGGNPNNLQDNYGHGTLVAGAIRSQNTALGIAPEANLLSIKVLQADGSGRVSDVIAALDWLIENRDLYNVRVINLSLSAPVFESYTTDPLCQAVQHAVEGGIVVVGAAGNAGFGDNQTLFGGIGSPANHPAVITVGASDPANTVVRSDDSVAWFSSRGPTLFDGVAKPDLLAPGVNLRLPVPTNATLARLSSVHPDPDGAWLNASGTSFSAALVSGTVALMLEQTPGLNPTEVKAILEFTAQDVINTHPLEQGAGLLNVAGAVQLASLWLTDAEVGADNLSSPLPDLPTSLIAGETVLWGTTIIWNGYALDDPVYYDLDLDVLVVGVVSGNGIIWDGGRIATVIWLDYNISGISLVSIRQSAYDLGTVWGTGIIWDGGFTAYNSVSFSLSSLNLWQGRLVDFGALQGLMVNGTPTRGMLDTDGSSVIWVPEF
ncbi:MAG: hypothetical protein CO108_10720 [Deltaproteobacteria bacterium CG_4_9_14_3_um_filter_63_12]|nr:MAG: hypothetical protein COW42_03130 [Deltaproteobacteria bacterium CG17_big_fil_post_rev_8_21_14_2_50_63_7]PJB43029.1 MAG: hypothetical protein CO108_10720 [Deltaproteobacteria bacterium CG_4_9_14_3_um_filter_63_12]